MKRIAKIIMGLIVAASLMTGCASQEGEADSEKKIEQYTIGIGQFGEHASLDNCRIGFIEGLAEAGIVEGKNLTILSENAQFDIGIANQIAGKFVGKEVDLIAAVATPMAQSAFNAAKDKDVPVIFTAVTDPVAAMLTKGNITGTSDKLPVEAQLQLIRMILPEAKKIGILYTTSEVNSESTIAQYKELAQDYGFEIVESGISEAVDIPLAVDKLLSKVDCLTNLTDNTVVGSLPVILNKANDKKIPVFGSEIEQMKIGCIAGEGLEYVELGKQTGQMAAKVLKGEKTPEEIPYETIEESSLYVNTDALKQLDISMPVELKDRAHDVIK